MTNFTQNAIDTIDEMISEEMNRVNESSEAISDVLAVLDMTSDMTEVSTFLNNLAYNS